MCNLCIEICTMCERECRKHDNVPACIKCADACNECNMECKKMMVKPQMMDRMMNMKEAKMIRIWEEWII